MKTNPESIIENDRLTKTIDCVKLLLRVKKRISAIIIQKIRHQLLRDTFQICQASDVHSHVKICCGGCIPSMKK